MLNDTFYLDGTDALDYGIRLQRPIEFSPAVPIVEKFHVPGRNGDFIFDTGAYENRTGVASCFALSTDVNSTIVNANKFLLSEHGYRRLECSNDPTHFWKARVSNGAKIQNRINKLNPFEIEFDCMPQRFLLSGEITREYSHVGRITFNNNYGGPALPLIKIYRNKNASSFIFNVGSYIIDGLFIAEDDSTLTDTLTFDCETQNVYSEDLNLNFNSRVGFSSKGFPKFDLGETIITIPLGIIDKIEVTPRWWDI